MKKRWGFLVLALIAGFSALLAPSNIFADELIVKDCTELLRLAEAYQEDLKTVDVVLGTVIDAGDMVAIKTYKLKKAAFKKRLDAVLKAIEIKECVKPR
jgi:hypothetical protein